MILKGMVASQVTRNASLYLHFNLSLAACITLGEKLASAVELLLEISLALHDADRHGHLEYADQLDPLRSPDDVSQFCSCYAFLVSGAGWTWLRSIPDGESPAYMEYDKAGQ